VTSIALAACTLHHAPGAALNRSPPNSPYLHLDGPVRVTAGETLRTSSEIAVAPYTVIVSHPETAAWIVDRMRQVLLTQPRRSEDMLRVKNLTLAVDYVTIVPGVGSFTCYVDYTVSTGNGTVRGDEAKASHWNYQKACDLAMENVAQDVFEARLIRKYLETSAESASDTK
jgi:hypothetical protein